MANLSAEILYSESDNTSYAKIKSSIHSMFDVNDPQIKITHAVLLMKQE